MEKMSLPNTKCNEKDTTYKKGLSFLDLKMSHIYNIMDIKTQKQYKLLIVTSLNNYYKEERVEISLYHPFQEGYFYTDYYCYDIENEKFVYLTELFDNFNNLYIKEIDKALNNEKLDKIRQQADKLYKQQAKTNKELDRLRDWYLMTYQEIKDTGVDRSLLSNVATNIEEFAYELLNSSSDVLSIEEFEKYLYECLSPEVKNLLNTPHKYTLSFRENRTGDDEEKKIYTLMIERTIKVKKDVKSLKCKKEEKRGQNIYYSLDKKHPEYQYLLMRERETESPYITTISFKDFPFSLGGSYAKGPFMDSLHLVDYRNRIFRYKDRGEKRSEGVYYHRYLLMHNYSIFKLTKENAEKLAKSIYLVK